MHELLWPDLSKPWEQEHRLKMLAEAHSRIASPLYNLAMMALALAAVIGGSFSRMGYGRRILIAGAAAVLLRVGGFAVQSLANDGAWLNLMQYVIPLGALVYALRLVLRSGGAGTRARPMFQHLAAQGAS
jgi:lipopolysaccharide export system permease protein